MKAVASVSFGLLFVLAGVARAETKIEMKGVHLCCGQCVKAVAGILKDIEGVKGTCDQAKKTVTITAKDDETAQKAVDALAAGGFHGDTGNKDVAVKDDSGVTAGKVKSLTVTGVHNCCGQCNGLIKKALKGVEGVKGDTAKAKAEEFEITGEFDAADVVKALNAAGFHVKVKK
jgi:copper chaperone CopZ